MTLTDEQIIEILDKWNLWNRKIETGIIREEYLKKLELFLKTDEIIAIVGVRRSGKSTILLQLLEHITTKKNVNKINTLYVNLEDDLLYPYLDIKLLNRIYEAYKTVLKPKGKVYIIFDEIQKIDGWEHFVRSIYDRKENAKIFVTGSSSKLLASEFSSLLTGRHLTLHIYPLNFKEYLKFKNFNIKTKLDEIHNRKKLIQISKEFLVDGGFPKIILTKNDLLKKELLTSYFNNIITRDIVERYKIRDISKIKNIALFYAANFCESVSFNSIKKTLSEKSVETIERYSAFLESSYLIFLNKKFDYSLRKQMANERKVYFIDNALRQAVAFQFKDMQGNLLENAVYLELLKRGKEIFYYKGKKEVDFIIQEGLNITLVINACWDLSDKETEKREIDSLIEAMESFNLKRGYIITINSERLININNKSIKVIPFYKLGLEKEL
ncbi:MAG: ATP-binding protein [Nanoarchaeota archaeon]|nr:ATP-binding protein [Nanoarchaeota archaeon]